MSALPAISIDTLGAGGIYSSVHDLILFGMFHLKNEMKYQEKVIPDEMNLNVLDFDSGPVGFGLFAGDWSRNHDFYYFKIMVLVELSPHENNRLECPAGDVQLQSPREWGRLCCRS